MIKTNNLIKRLLSFPGLLVLISLILCIVNYIPGTWLSGWDTIHPEFNFGEYFQRIFSFWQQHQGLGAPASQAHASELPRMLLYFPTSLLVPDSILRYIYFFACLILGPLGVYYFIKSYVSRKLNPKMRDSIAFASGLLYLINLTTLQHFYVPLEMFTTHYALLGWVFLFATRQILEPSRKNLIWLTVTIFFSAPMAHTPTLFYSFFFVFALYLLSFSLIAKKFLKKAALILLLTLAINCFWLLPNLYYVSNYGEAVANSKIHSQFSDRAFQVGQNFGNIQDTAILKNFLFDWGEYDEENGVFVHLLGTWQEHLKNPLVTGIGILIFLVTAGGLLYSVIRKVHLALVFLPVIIVPFFFINNDNEVFNQLTALTQAKFPILKESLRFPYTKFSILLLFAYCIYFALALNVLLPAGIKLMRKLGFRFNPKHLATTFILIFTATLVIYGWPAFTGNFIDRNMKVNIPQSYFDLYEWSKGRPASERIMPLPMQTFWGWVYHDWGFEGAGFQWFGLKQPLLDREFDRWMPYNENFYWEMSYAVYSQNLPLIENVLEKYQVSWIMLDQSVVDASSTKSPYLDQIQSLISSSSRIKADKQFGQIKLYHFDLEVQAENFVSVLDNLPTVGPVYKRTNFDTAFSELGNYLSIQESDSSQPEVYYPFRSLFSNQSSDRHEFTIEETSGNFIFKKTVPSSLTGYQVVTPEQQSLVWYDPKNLDVAGSAAPIINYSENVLTVTVPKVKNYFSANIDLTKIKPDAAKNCDYLNILEHSQDAFVSNQNFLDKGQPAIRLSARLANNCSTQFLLPLLPHDYGYIFAIESRNVRNKPVLFWLENLNSRKPDMELFLPSSRNFATSFYVQPPLEKFAQGYFLHFDNVSFNKRMSVNDIKSVRIYPIPYELLVSISLRKNGPTIGFQPNDCQTKVVHSWLFLYNVNLSGNCQGNLALYQSYDQGWQAVRKDTLPLKSLTKHQLLNNWANVWEIPPMSRQITIFYVPQLLQILGYLILGITFILVFLRKRKTH